MADAKMVVVNGVRYRPEDAPEQDDADDKTSDDAGHKMRSPRKSRSKT